MVAVGPFVARKVHFDEGRAEGGARRGGINWVAAAGPEAARDVCKHHQVRAEIIGKINFRIEGVTR